MSSGEETVLFNLYTYLLWLVLVIRRVTLLFSSCLLHQVERFWGRIPQPGWVISLILSDWKWHGAKGHFPTWLLKDCPHHCHSVHSNWDSESLQAHWAAGSFDQGFLSSNLTVWFPMFEEEVVLTGQSIPCPRHYEAGSSPKKASFPSFCFAVLYTPSGLANTVAWLLEGAGATMLCVVSMAVAVEAGWEGGQVAH